MKQNDSTVRGRPVSVFNVFMSIGNQPCPGLLDTQAFECALGTGHVWQFDQDIRHGFKQEIHNRMTMAALVLSTATHHYQCVALAYAVDQTRYPSACVSNLNAPISTAVIHVAKLWHVNVAMVKSGRERLLVEGLPV